jgi:hypothetical protein
MDKDNGVSDGKGEISKDGIATPKDPRVNLSPRKTSSPADSLVDSVDSLQRYRKHVTTIKNSARYQRFVASKKNQRQTLKQGSVTKSNKDVSPSQTLPKAIVDMILESSQTILDEFSTLKETNVQSLTESPSSSLEFPHVGSEDRLSPIQRLHVKKQSMNFIRAAGLMTRSTPRMAVNAITARTPRMNAAGVSTPGINSRVTWWDDNENMNNKSFTLKTDESCAMSYETSYSYEDLLKLGWCNACEGMILDDDSTYNYSYPNDASLDSDDTLDDELQFNIKLIERYKETMFGWLKNVKKP